MATNFTAKPVDYVSLLNLMAQMDIASHASLRLQVRNRVYKTFPELENATTIPGNTPFLMENRTMEISPEERSAIGHGLWKIYQTDGVIDSVRTTILDLSKPGKVDLYGWMKNKIASLPPAVEIIPSDEEEGVTEIPSDPSGENA